MTLKKVRLLKNVSAVVFNQLLRKLKDPEAPFISCDIRGVTFDKALLDLRANVNLLSTSIYEQFDIGELKPTPIILELVDRSIKTTKGLIEDVIVKVNECYFLLIFSYWTWSLPRKSSILLSFWVDHF